MGGWGMVEEFFFSTVRNVKPAGFGTGNAASRDGASAYEMRSSPHLSDRRPWCAAGAAGPLALAFLPPAHLAHVRFRQFS